MPAQRAAHGTTEHATHRTAEWTAHFSAQFAAIGETLRPTYLAT